MVLICENGGGRLDVWLAGKYGGLTRSGAQKCINAGNVLINGVRAAKNNTVKTGDVIMLEAPRPGPSGAAPQNIALDVVYEDGHIIVVNKPRGMVVHPGNGNGGGTLANALAYHCGGGLSDAGGAFRPGIVHRLDKDTSGLVVAAKTNEDHAKLAADFKNRKVRKIYYAVVCGHVEAESGRIEMPVGRHAADRTKMAAVADGGREAVTLFKVAERTPCGYTWLELEILTGRTHQIRVHLARIGRPVAGDPIYGSGGIRAVCSGRDACGLKPAGRGCPLAEAAEGLLLHAAELDVTHPATGARMAFKCAPPDYFPRPSKMGGK